MQARLVLTLKLKNCIFGDFPSNPEVKTTLPMQGARVRSLVRELRSHILYGVAKKKKKKTMSFKKNSFIS